MHDVCVCKLKTIYLRSPQIGKLKVLPISKRPLGTLLPFDPTPSTTAFSAVKPICPYVCAHLPPIVNLIVINLLAFLFFIFFV